MLMVARGALDRLASASTRPQRISRQRAQTVEAADVHVVGRNCRPLNPESQAIWSMRYGIDRRPSGVQGCNGHQGRRPIVASGLQLGLAICPLPRRRLCRSNPASACSLHGCWQRPCREPHVGLVRRRLFIADPPSSLVRFDVGPVSRKKTVGRILDWNLTCTPRGDPQLSLESTYCLSLNLGDRRLRLSCPAHHPAASRTGQTKNTRRLANLLRSLSTMRTKLCACIALCGAAAADLLPR